MDEPQNTPAPKEPLLYEETPVIEPTGAEPTGAESQEKSPFMPSSVSAPVAPAPEMPTPTAPIPSSTPSPISEIPEIKPITPLQPAPSRRGTPLLLFLILAVLFGLGVFASSYLRQFLTPAPVEKISGPTPIVPTPTLDPYLNWKTFFVISGVTHKAIDGISFRMPPAVSDLFCDGVGCPSQGTTMPGGTRFTVAARGAGQTLSDYRGKIVSDFAGKPFDTTPTTAGGRPGVSFVGNFTGTTVTGYSFTKMRGVMISVTDTVSLEVNHFTPTSTPTADFAGDDILFGKILDSFVFTLPVPVVVPITPAATSSAH